MASKRTFYRTVFQLEVLSRHPVDFDSVSEADEATTTGDCSGSMSHPVSNEEVNGPTMAKLLVAQGSEPSFFDLDDEGNDVNEDEDDN